MPVSDPEELDEVLGSLGHEVEGWETIAPTFEGVIVGRVESVKPHPDADKVRLCRVDNGTETLDVVCGAWNFEAGAIVAYAEVGARLGLDGDEPFEIGRREIRGTMSNGMICSARELGVGEDHEGILVLDRLGVAAEADVGRDVAEVLPIADVVLDVSITPNRGDCMSILGLARELGAYFDLPVRDPDVTADVTGPPIEAKVNILDSEACPRFVARQVDGVTIGASPLWMQLRLLAVGQRPISNVVDVSNYVMFEIGHPIHTFDADTVADRSLDIRRASPDETLETLDGSVRALEASDIVVTDKTGPIALAGVMGGLSTEVTDATTNILVEAANWHPPSIMHSSRRLNLTSEASKRFERGVDPNLSGIATLRTAKLIAETGDGIIREGVVDAYPARREPWTVHVSAGEISRLLGPAPAIEESARLLERLGFGTTIDGSSIVVAVPTRRPDVTRPADVIEEIGRLYGYDNFQNRVRRGMSGRLSPSQRAERTVRSALIGAGFSEAQTLSFIGQADLDLMRIPPGDARSRGLRVTNPLKEEEGTMRTTLLPGLLKAVAYNTGHGAGDVALFEIGKVFLPMASSADHRIPAQPDQLAFVAAGSTGIRGWNGTMRPVDFFTASGMIELLARVTGRELTIERATPPSLHPGRAATTLADGDGIGFIGELHPAVSRAFGLKGRVAVGEIALAPLTDGDHTPWSLRETSSFPPVLFDLAFDVAHDVPAGAVRAAIMTAAGELAERVELFDVFRGGSMEAGRKSLAYRVMLRDAERTLTDEAVAPIRDAIIDHVRAHHDARLRGG